MNKLLLVGVTALMLAGCKKEEEISFEGMSTKEVLEMIDQFPVGEYESHWHKISTAEWSLCWSNAETNGPAYVMSFSNEKIIGQYRIDYSENLVGGAGKEE